jgi:hypothetical protein
VYAGERGAKMQKRAMQRQQVAQMQAEARASSQERRAMMEANRTRQKRADVSSLLAAAQATGGNPTMLTGPQGATTTMLGG